MLRLSLFRMSAGFNTLREFVASRPTLRHEALRVLLELTTHDGALVPLPFSALVLTVTLRLQKRSLEGQRSTRSNAGSQMSNQWIASSETSHRGYLGVCRLPVRIPSEWRSILGP